MDVFSSDPSKSFLPKMGRKLKGENKLLNEQKYPYTLANRPLNGRKCPCALAHGQFVLFLSFFFFFFLVFSCACCLFFFLSFPFLDDALFLFLFFFKFISKVMGVIVVLFFFFFFLYLFFLFN